MSGGATSGRWRRNIDQRALRNRRDHAHADLARQLAGAIDHQVLRARVIGEHRQKQLVHPAAFARRLHPLRRAHEQSLAQLLLDLGDLHAQRGLHDV